MKWFITPLLLAASLPTLAVSLEGIRLSQWDANCEDGFWELHPSKGMYITTHQSQNGFSLVVDDLKVTTQNEVVFRAAGSDFIITTTEAGDLGMVIRDDSGQIHDAPPLYKCTSFDSRFVQLFNDAQELSSKYPNINIGIHGGDFYVSP